MWYATNTKTFAKESKFCLRVLTQLDTFVHGSDDVCLGQEMVRTELSGYCNHSECGASTQAVLHPSRPRSK